MPRVELEVRLTVEVVPEELGVLWDPGDPEASKKALAEAVREKIEDDLSDLEPDVDDVDVVSVEYGDEEEEDEWWEDDDDEEDEDEEDWWEEDEDEDWEDDWWEEE